MNKKGYIVNLIVAFIVLEVGIALILLLAQLVFPNVCFVGECLK